jgi:hypothetical protein
MIAFWTPPYSLLGEDDAYMDIIYSVYVVITDVDPDQHKTIESITATVTDCALQKYFTITTNIQNAEPPVNSRASVTIIGAVPSAVETSTRRNSTFVKIDVAVSDGSTASKVYEIRHHQNYDETRDYQ